MSSKVLQQAEGQGPRKTALFSFNIHIAYKHLVLKYCGKKDDLLKYALTYNFKVQQATFYDIKNTLFFLLLL